MTTNAIGVSCPDALVMTGFNYMIDRKHLNHLAQRASVINVVVGDDDRIEGVFQVGPGFKEGCRVAG